MKNQIHFMQQRADKSLLKYFLLILVMKLHGFLNPVLNVLLDWTLLTEELLIAMFKVIMKVSIKLLKY